MDLGLDPGVVISIGDQAIEAIAERVRAAPGERVLLVIDADGVQVIPAGPAPAGAA